MERKIDRLDIYMKSNRLNDNKITTSAGLTNGIIGKSRKEGRDLSAKSIELILNTYPDLNPNWLLTGKGDMLKPAKNPFSQMTEREIGESVSEVIMDMYTKGEIYPASIYDKAIAEKNKEISARDSRIEELQREIWQLQNKIDELSK